MTDLWHEMQLREWLLIRVTWKNPAFIKRSDDDDEQGPDFDDLKI